VTHESIRDPEHVREETKRRLRDAILRQHGLDVNEFGKADAPGCEPEASEGREATKPTGEASVPA
jgi:hypothetical protein